MRGMVTGSLSPLKPPLPPGGEEAGLGFDPRPWPLVVGMMGALLGVFFALRPAEKGEAVGRRAGITVPALADAKESIEQGVTLTFRQAGKTDVRGGRVIVL